MPYIFQKEGTPYAGDGGVGTNPETTIVGYILMPNGSKLNVSSNVAILAGIKAKTHAVILNDNMAFEDTSEDDVTVDGIAGAKFYIRDGKSSEVLTLASNSGVLKELKKLKRTTRYDVLKIDANGGLIGSELTADDTEDASTTMRGLTCELTAGKMQPAGEGTPKVLALTVNYKKNSELNENYLYAIPNFTMLEITSIAKVTLVLSGSNVKVVLDDGVLHGDGDELVIGGLKDYFLEGASAATGITFSTTTGEYTGFTAAAVVSLDLASQIEDDLYYAEDSVTIPT